MTRVQVRLAVDGSLLIYYAAAKPGKPGKPQIGDQDGRQMYCSSEQRRSFQRHFYFPSNFMTETSTHKFIRPLKPSPCNFDAVLVICSEVKASCVIF